ncbi:ATP-dependent metallopeptidase FtsH/Yme1/Tma family protein [candidate division TA06 bacterium]|uniref:ATP-dependent zinc metalloprotease FtsH n=1 Tax=candidate division TA06 bacterium TaxID=2250710 RepID=A0A933MK83_UNCT6|nr:ATP-dependent metallopeptidase FtsH/Yme1/Tma family protein [candidate division TA06 bacterium]
MAEGNKGNKGLKRIPSPKGFGDGLRAVLIWVILVMLAIALYNLFSKPKDRQLDIIYSQFREELNVGNISQVTFTGREVKGNFKSPKMGIKSGVRLEYPKFKTFLPIEDPNLIAELEARGVRIKAESTEPSGLVSFLMNYGFLIVLGVLWFLFMRQMQGGQKGVFSFGKSRARLSQDKIKVTFSDVAGADEAKADLREIIEFLKEPKKFTKLGGKIPKGALLLGSPGTGKTLLARAVAGEAAVPFFSISGSDFVEMFVGVGAARVRDLFEQGKRSAPCIIFIDEIDAVGRHRGAGLGGGHDEREQTLNALLVEMDGFAGNEGVIILAATNRPDVLDPALMRPGRFDRVIVVDRPDVVGREGILKVHTKNKPLASDVDLKILARGTPGFSGADIANMVNEAALLAARKNHDKVYMQDMEEAKDKVLMGAERKSMVITDDEKKMTAYHEAGHTLVSRLTKDTDPIHKVTIIPRGRAMGVTVSLPTDEKHNYSRTWCLNRMAIMLGGRAAEMLIFKDLSTGSGNDIEQATELARKMVCEWGMSRKLGPVTFGKKDEEIFLGRDYGHIKNYSEQTAELIDSEIRTLVDGANQKASKLLKDNQKILENLAAALLDRECLDGEQVELIIKGQPLPERAGLASDKPSDKKPGDKKASANA